MLNGYRPEAVSFPLIVYVAILAMFPPKLSVRGKITSVGAVKEDAIG